LIALWGIARSTLKKPNNVENRRDVSRFKTPSRIYLKLNHPNKDLKKLKVQKNNNDTDLIMLVRKNNQY
jgi:hypothetical protein